MNNPMLIVFAHDDYQAMFDMNLPLWESHGAPILVVCPIGRSVRTKHTVREFGKIGSMGPEMVKRHLLAMKAVIDFTSCTHFVFFECDAICVTKELPLKNGLWGNTFRNVDGDWGHFQEKWVTWQYLNFPWVIDRRSLLKIIEAADHYPDVIEAGYVDRWIAVMAQAAGVPMVRFSPRGFTRSRINHDDPVEMDELESVIRFGGTMFHGVKRPEDQELILSLREKYFPKG